MSAQHPFSEARWYIEMFAPQITFYFSVCGRAIHSYIVPIFATVGSFTVWRQWIVQSRLFISEEVVVCMLYSVFDLVTVRHLMVVAGLYIARLCE